MSMWHELIYFPSLWWAHAKPWLIVACFLVVIALIPTRIYRGVFALGVILLLLAIVLGIAAI